jgi:hypothetical protein
VAWLRGGDCRVFAWVVALAALGCAQGPPRTSEQHPRDGGRSEMATDPRAAVVPVHAVRSSFSITPLWGPGRVPRKIHDRLYEHGSRMRRIAEQVPSDQDLVVTFRVGPTGQPVGTNVEVPNRLPPAKKAIIEETLSWYVFPAELAGTEVRWVLDDWQLLYIRTGAVKQRVGDFGLPVEDVRRAPIRE